MVINLKRDFEQFKEVNKLTATPIPRVAAKPFTKLVPSKKSIRQLKKVVMWPSRIDELALWKPLSIERIKLLPLINSSLIRSKINMLASTAIPILSINPEIPGSVSVTGIREYKARLKKP